MTYVLKIITSKIPFELYVQDLTWPSDVLPQVTNGCIVGATCQVTGQERLPELTVLYGGSAPQRRVAGERPPAQTLQLDFLSKILPNYHHLRKASKAALGAQQRAWWSDEKLLRIFAPGLGIDCHDLSYPLFSCPSSCLVQDQYRKTWRWWTTNAGVHIWTCCSVVELPVYAISKYKFKRKLRPYTPNVYKKLT